MTAAFINRSRELAFLRDRWASERAELVVVFGRRRTGKTFLLTHFSRELPTVYYPAARLPEAQQLKELGALMGERLGNPILIENGFRDWEQFFRLLADTKEKLLIVLDEYPYLVESSAGLSSRLQRAWDHHLKDAPHMIVLCGSSMAMMVRETLDSAAPLFGRRTGQLKVEAMDAIDTAGFIPGWGPDDRVRVHSVFGGVPHYLAQLDLTKSFAENLFDIVVRLGAPLRDEAEFLLRQELQEPRVYFGILAAIAGGNRKLSEIVNTTGVPHGSVSKYLAVLQHLGIVDREVPVTETRPEKSKKGLYRITDPFTWFWFRHLLPLRGLLEAGREKEALARVMDQHEASVPAAYEEIARSLLRCGLLDRPTGRRWATVGRWWDRQSEIDVLAFTAERDAILVGEAKWSTKSVGTDILEKLESTADRLPSSLSSLPRHFALFSRSGFTPAVVKAVSNRKDLSLVDGFNVM